MIFNLRWPLVLSALLVLAACDGNSDSDDQASELPAAPAVSGTIEVIHASQDAPAVNVVSDGAVVVSDLDYLEAEFLTLDIGDVPVEVEGILADGSTVTVIPADGDPVPVLALGEDQRVTVIAANDVANIAPIVLVDDQPAVAADEVRLRVVHAASVAADVEVWVSEPGLDLTNPGGGTLINAVFNFGETLTVDPLVVPAGDYQVRVSAPGDPGNPFFDSGTITLPGGADLVIAAVVNTGPGDAPIKLLASTGDALLEFSDVSTPATVRVVHGSPDAPAVDLLVNDTIRAVEGAPYQAVTDYIPLAPATYNLKVVPATGAPADAVLEADVPFEAGSETTAIAVGTLTDAMIPLELLALEDNNRAVATEAKLRLVHGSVSAGEVDIYVAAGGTLTVDVDTTQDFLFTATAVPFKAETGYLALPPGSYDVAVTPTGSTGAAIGPVTVDLAAGGIYTAIARDETGIGLPLGLILLDDFTP
jgi:hypothetical protein